MTSWFMLYDMGYPEVDQKKAHLDSKRPLNKALVANLEEWFQVELTYTSNAIEGNTLTRRETALVVEKGITVGGKTLVEHLEATNHVSAIKWISNQVSRKLSQLTENDILTIHSLILKGIDDDNAGHYRSLAVRVAGSTVIFPNPRKVPDLMAAFACWLKKKHRLHPIQLAAEAHYRLVTIHPFIDGNGRTARLLMNLVLLMHGYPPAIVRPKDRLAYIKALEQAQLGGAKENFESIILDAVDRSLDIYLHAISGKTPIAKKRTLLKIGELAQKTGETISTIRYWTKEKLLEVEQKTASGYQLYSSKMVERVKIIQTMKEKRLTLKEIKAKLKG